MANQGPKAVQNVQWYALHVASSTEALVSRKLTEAGIEAYYPFTMVQPKRQRRAPFARPIWPGYVFARFVLANRTPVIQIPMVIQILGTAHQPAPIPAHEIEAIRQMAASASASLSACTYAAGETVTITSGPLQDLTGIVIRVKGTTRLVISIESIQQSMSCEVDAADCQVAQPFLTNPTISIVPETRSYA